MDELGSVLREAREAKGLTIDEAQEQTRINARYLQALEEGRYEALPTPVHVRGFLRNYARLLSLDPEPLLERYEASRNHQPLPVPTHGGESISPQEPLPARNDQPFFEPVNVSLSGGNRRGPESTLRLVIIAALILAIALAASRFVPMLLGQGDGRERITEAIQALLENEEGVEPLPAATVEVLDPNLTPEPILPSTSRNNPAALPTPDLPTPTRPPLPATMEVIQLRLDISERTWLRVTIDGETVLEGQYKLEDGPFEWEAQEEVTILTGNGAGVFVTINGIELGRLAGRGEVWEETWRTTAN